MFKGRAARLGPWDKPLDFNLHINYEGEPRIPFALYVKPDPVGSNLACSTFPQFCLLPVELQRHVLYFCDGPTLFQLMHISVTRPEAKKLFWSDPHTWYYLDGGWLRYGGQTGETFYDLSFLVDVERVNICFNWLEARQWTQTRPQHMDQMDMLRRFWRLVQDFCPRLTHVLISTHSRRSQPLDSLPTFLGTFLRLCPAGINISLSLLQGHQFPGEPNYKPRCERSLWRPIGNDTSTANVEYQWEKVFTDWAPRIVLLPPKNFHGPVGAYQRRLYRSDRRMMQIQATELLLVDAIERNHFHERHNPFVCFAPDCQVWFKAPGEYLLHAFQTGHITSASPPENVKALFDKHNQNLDRLYGQDDYELYDQDTKEYSRGTSSYGPIQSPCDEDQAMISEMEAEELYYKDYFENQVMLDEREHKAMRKFLYQLKHDPLYVTMFPAEESGLWDSFMQDLDSMRG